MPIHGTRIQFAPSLQAVMSSQSCVAGSAGKEQALTSRREIPIPPNRSCGCGGDSSLPTVFEGFREIHCPHEYDVFRHV